MAIDINIPSQVKNYTNLAGFPVTGALKTIFIAEDTNKTYRWTGSAYVEISATAASTWGAIGGTLSAQTDLQNALNAKVTGNTAITGATKTKVTYDSKGLVTAGADATTADIADSTNKRYVTDANLTVIGNTSGTNTGDQTLIGLGGVPTSRTLTINGTTQDLSADRTFTISTGITIGTTAITSGTVGRVLFEGTGNVVSESANLFWDNTNARLGLGTATPSAPLGIVGSTATTGLISITNNFSGQYPNAMTILFPNQTSSSLQSAAFYVGKALTSKNGYGFNYIHSADASNANRGSIAFYGVDNILNWFASGNVTLNSTTDAGFKLDVNGTARVSSNINTSGQFTNVNTNNFTTAPIALRSIGADISGISIYKASFSHTNSIQFLSNDTNNRFSIGQGYIGASSSIDFNIARFASSAWTNSFTIFNATGNVGINTTTDVASSKLTIESTTQGFLPPRMTTTQKNAIATPATGLMVYDTTLNLMALYNGTVWTTL